MPVIQAVVTSVMGVIQSVVQTVWPVIQGVISTVLGAIQAIITAEHCRARERYDFVTGRLETIL